MGAAARADNQVRGLYLARSGRPQQGAPLGRYAELFHVQSAVCLQCLQKSCCLVFVTGLAVA